MSVSDSVHQHTALIHMNAKLRTCEECVVTLADAYGQTRDFTRAVVARRTRVGAQKSCGTLLPLLLRGFKFHVQLRFIRE